MLLARGLAAGIVAALALSLLPELGWAFQFVYPLILALGAASIGGLIWRHPIAYRVLGLAWTVFGTLHFAYHALHLAHMPLASAIGEMVALGISLLLGVVLLIPERSSSAHSSAQGSARSAR